MPDTRINVVVDAVDRASDKVSAGTDRMSQSMEQVAKKARMAGVAMTAMGGAGLYAAKQLTEGALDVERGYADVSTMMDDTRGATEVYRDEIQELTKELGVQGGEIEATAALYQVLSAGVEEGAASMEVLEVSMRAARAGVTETDVAVDALTTVLNAYNMEASEAERVSDVLFQTVREGKVRFDEIATSIGTVVPIASEMGIEIEQLTAAIATMSASGMKANKATTYLRQAMTQFMKPSDAMREAVEELGYESATAMVEQEGLIQSLNMLYDQTGQSQEGMAELIPSVRALSGVMALVGESSEDAMENLDAMYDSSDAMQEGFDEHADTLAMRSDQVDERFKQISNTLGDSTAPATITLKEKMADLGEVIVDVDDRLGGAIGTVFTFGSAALSVLGPLVSTTAQMWLMMNATNSSTGAILANTKARLVNTGAMLKQKAGLIATTATTKMAAVGTGILTAAQWAYNASLYACPLVWIIALIVGLIAVIYLLWKHTDEVRAAFERLWEYMQVAWDGIKKFAGWIKDVFFKYLEFWVELFKNIGEVAVNAVNKIIEFFSGLPSKIFEEIKRVILEAYEWGIDMAKELVDGFIDGIKNLGDRAWGAISGVFSFDDWWRDKKAYEWGTHQAEYHVEGFADQMGRADSTDHVSPNRTGSTGSTDGRPIEVNQNFEGILGLSTAEEKREFFRRNKRVLEQVINGG